jgi:3-deoxy-D-manno-octulosonic-acid transferase
MMGAASAYDMYLFYTLALALAVLLSSPWWLGAMLVSGKYREGFRERLGRVPPRVTESLQGAQTVWLHAVSVGELLAATPLIEALQRELTATRPGVRLVISTTTRTAQQLAKEKFGETSVFYFPFDFPWCIDAWMSALRPQLIVLLETEFWPNFLQRAARHQIPVAVVNARISDRSFPRYRALRFLWRHILSPVRLALAQSALDAERLQEVGIPAGRIHMTGNLKYDVPLADTPPSDIVTALRRHLPDGPPVWICGSTAEGEEAALLAAHRRVLEHNPEVILILAPRHPERFAQVAALAPHAVRRSTWMQSPFPLAPGSVFLLDSIGELAAVYALGYVAFLGNSLAAPGGGQNPLEPASFGLPILAGPHMQNFRGIAKALQASGSLITTSAESLATDVIYLLDNPGQAFERGEAARNQVEANRGATERCLQHLAGLLPGRNLYVKREPAELTEAAARDRRPGRPVRVK